VPNALDLLDEHVHGFGRADARRAPAGGGERGEQLWLPGVEGAGEAEEFGDLGAGAAVQDLPEPMFRVESVAAALIEQHQLLGDDPGVGELPGWVTEHEGVLNTRPLPLVQGREGPAEQPPSSVERVVPVAAPAQGLLLHTTSDVIDRSQPEAHDVERVQDASGVRQAGAKGGRVAAERV